MFIFVEIFVKEKFKLARNKIKKVIIILFCKIYEYIYKDGITNLKQVMI